MSGQLKHFNIRREDIDTWVCENTHGPEPGSPVIGPQQRAWGLPLILGQLGHNIASHGEVPRRVTVIVSY